MKLRLDPLRGALACLPKLESAHENPWRLPWRTLSTNHPCHLADLLRTLPSAVFPPFLQVDEGEEETQQTRGSLHASDAQGCAERPTRLVVGNLARRATTITSSNLEEREVIALLGLRLTPCHWSIMRLLLTHPLLSHDELAGLLGLELKSMHTAVSSLHALGCLEPISTSVGKRWRLCERGLRLISIENHLSLRHLVDQCDEEAHPSPMVQLGVRWLLAHIQHTVGIYSFFATLAQGARQHPEQRMCWWETGAQCERRYRMGEQWHNLRPDAQAEFRAGSQPFRFWLEWARGTMNVRDLALKFDAYRHFVSSGEWAQERSRLPRLLCVAPDIAQELRMQRVAQARLTQTPRLGVWTTTGVLLQANGPSAPIWMQVTFQRNQPDKASVVRRCNVFDENAGGKGREEAVYQHS